MINAPGAGAPIRTDDLRNNYTAVCRVETCKESCPRAIVKLLKKILRKHFFAPVSSGTEETSKRVNELRKICTPVQS